MGNNFVYPSLKNAKHLDRLEDYRKYTISQILESFRFWISSDYSSGISLTKLAFDDVFGNLFDDCDLHFDSFIYKGVTSCSTYDVFYVLILMSDDVMSNKIHLLFQLGKEQDVTFRVDIIQGVFYKIIMSCQLLFNLPAFSRDEIHLFIETQLIQFVERNAANTLDASLLESIELGGGLSSVTGCNHALKTMCFLDIFQWCQDVHQINNFMEAVDNITFDKRGKNNNHSISSSPRTSSSKTTKRNSTMIAAVAAMRLSAQRARKASVVHVTKVKPDANKVSSSRSSHLFTRVVHPLWQHSIQDIIANYGGNGYDTATATAVPSAMPSGTPSPSSSARASPSPPVPPPSTRVEVAPYCFFEDIPDVSSEDLLFNALEQCILSDNRALPIFVREPVPHSDNTRTSLLMRGDSFKRPTMISTNSATGASLTGDANSTNNISKDRYELFGIMDITLALSWIVQCSPNSVLQLVKQDEEMERLQQKQSQEFGLNKSILMTGTSADSGSAMHSILANIQQKDSEESHATEAERTFSLASVAIPNMNRLRARASLTGHQWQETGENIAHTTLRYIMTHNKFLLPTQRYTRQHTYTIDQYMYNAVYSMARGHNYVPIAGISSKPYRVTHVLTANHVIRFVLGHAVELLGKFRESVCVTSGLMRQPVVLSNKLNFGSALYKMAKHHLDSVLVTDDKNRIQVVLTNKCVTDFWFVWCQQARKLDRSLTLADIQTQYRNKTFKTYKESENVTFSIFSSLLTPLVHCQAILNIAIVSFDKFLAAGRIVPKKTATLTAKGRLSGTKKVSMATIVESKNYSDTDSNSDDSERDSDREEGDSSPEGGDGRGSRPRTASSTERNSEDDGEDSDEGEGHKAKKKKAKKSLKLKKGSVSHHPPLGSKSPPTKKKSLSVVSEHHPIATASPVPVVLTSIPEPSAPPPALITPTAPKGSMRSSTTTARRTVVPAAATPSVAATPTPAQPASRMTSMVERAKSPTNTAADRASIVASAAKATQLVNQSRLTAMNGPQPTPVPAAMERPSLSINIPATTGGAGAVPPSVAAETPTRRQTDVSPILASPTEGQVRSPMRIISHRMTKQQILAAKVAAAQKRELQEEFDARVREARTLENWFRTMRLLTPTDSIQTALQMMLLTDSTRAYIANNQGEPVGVVTFQDICKEMVLQEAKLKQTQLEKRQQENQM